MERALSAIGKIPPQNLEAEESTLGSMMLEKTALEKGLEILRAGDFYRPNHQEIFDALGSRAILKAMTLSAKTSLAALGLIMLVAIPVGYALSRYRFPGSALADSLVDLPMVAPPLIIGVSLLVFFQTPIGRWISGTGLEFAYTVKGIVLCQFLASSSYGIRAAKAAFDGVDTDLENLALTLGCSPLGAFRRVTLPLARNGLLAAGIIAWAHAVGLFAPLQVFAGAIRMKTEVMPTAIYLELSVGRIEKALAISLIMLTMAGAALVALHWLAPGRRARK